MSQRRNWIDVKTFKQLMKWIRDDSKTEIDWHVIIEKYLTGNVKSDVLFRIGKDFGDKIFIGISGGQKAFKEMTSDQIKNSSWGISITKNSSQWIDGATFAKIIETKAVFLI